MRCPILQRISRDNCAIPQAQKTFAILSLQVSHDMKSAAGPLRTQYLLGFSGFGVGVLASDLEVFVVLWFLVILEKGQEFSGDPNPQYFLKSTAVQMGGVLPYKWEAYGSTMGGVLLGSLSSRLRNQEGPAIQMGGVLPYKLQ